MVHSHVIGQCKHRASSDRAPNSTRIESPWIVVPVVEITLVHRNDFAISAMPQVTGLPLKYIGSVIGQPDDILAVAVRMTPVEAIEGEAF